MSDVIIRPSDPQVMTKRTYLQSHKFSDAYIYGCTADKSQAASADVLRVLAHPPIDLGLCLSTVNKVSWTNDRCPILPETLILRFPPQCRQGNC